MWGRKMTKTLETDFDDLHSEMWLTVSELWKPVTVIQQWQWQSFCYTFV